MSSKAVLFVEHEHPPVFQCFSLQDLTAIWIKPSNFALTIHTCRLKEISVAVERQPLREREAVMANPIHYLDLEHGSTS